MNKLFKIIKQEFYKTVKTKAFIIITIIGPFLIAGIYVLQSLTARFDVNNITAEKRIVKVIGINEEIYQKIDAATFGLNVELKFSDESLDNLKNQVIDNEITGFLEFPNIYKSEDIFKEFKYEYYTKEKNPIFGQILSGIIGEIIVSAKLESKNISFLEGRKYLTKPKIESIRISDEGESSERDVISLIFTIIGFIMMLYMSLVFYGQMIASSVNKEKSSKTVEIMLSSVKTSDMMFGKIFGLGLSGILQYAIWFLMAIVTLNFVLPNVGLSISAISIETADLLYLVLFFLLAFFLYASIYAGIGAMAKDMHDVSQLSIPVIFFLAFGMIASNTIITSPDSPFIKALSYIPFTSPMVMFGRILVKMPPVHEILICISILIVTIILMGVFVSKIFRVGILISGKKANIKEIVKWLKYK